MSGGTSKLLKHLNARKLWLVLVPFLLCVMDAAVTLMGQPDQYWADGFNRVNEANPSAGFAMRLSPFHFALERLIYIAAWSGLIILAPPKIALVASLWVTIAHTIGTFSWIYGTFGWNYYEVSVFMFFVSLILSLSWFRSGYFTVGLANE